MRIRVLPLGVAYMVLAAVMAAAAANTGNNALYMITALMLGLLILSGLLSVHSLGRLTIGRIHSPDLYARRPAWLYIEVHNRGRWTLCGIRLNDRDCPPIPPGQSRLVRLEVQIPARGLHRLPPLLLETRFPFGFLSRQKTVGGGNATLVYPALNSQNLPFRNHRGERGQEGRFGRWGEIVEQRGLKSFVEGDDPRHIHWKKSAQRGQPIAVDYERRSSGSHDLFLDTRTADPIRFEREVEAVAGHCDRLLRQGCAVGLITPHRRILAGVGEGQRRRLLGFLALVERES